MCGIVGCFHPGAHAGALAGQVAQMAATVVHRGPDAGDSWVAGDSGIAFGFRRLAIVDLTTAGMQPMQSPSGRYTVVFNGEIYNHRQLRAELVPDHAWRGTSDTEVMLAAIERWGVAAALPRLHGMFAIALWDAHERTLTLARDRLGEKPLYYGVHGGALLFGSELKALRAHSAFRAEVDRESLARYLYASFVPGPRSIFAGTWKLPPGTSITIDAAAVGSGALPEPVPYWRLRDHVERSTTLDDHEAVDRLEALLLDAVGRQMEADVPLGAFLSGGVDSSTIVALMQSQSSRPVQTFTVAIPEAASLDESAFAARVAAHLGTDHHSLDVTAVDARGVIPRLAAMYDEPFADSSQIPTHLVSALARRTVTVALSGDGGDEVFGGYRRYLLAPTVARRTRRLPMVAARAGRAAITGVPVRMWDRMRPGLGSNAHRVAGLLTSHGIDDVYERVFGTVDGMGLARGDSQPWSLFDGIDIGQGSPVDRMMYHDAMTYLPDDICAKVDRAAMAVSLETRMPFLDHRVVEFAWSLPATAHLRGDVTKWALRQVLARHVPTTLTDRPKAGFGIPLGAWLRGPLRDWADDLLAVALVEADGFLDSSAVTRLWGAHRSSARDHTNVLWNVLMFQSWLHAEQ